MYDLMSIVHSAVKGLLVNSGKFLILKQKLNDGSHKWDLPGGRIKFGETPLDTLKREVKEEVGIDVEIQKPVGMWYFFRQNDGHQVVATTFLCKPITNIVKVGNEEDENIVEHRWVTFEEFLTDEYDVSHESLKKMIEESKEFLS